MRVDALLLGLGLVALGAALIRYRAPIANWQIASRIEETKRSSLLNEGYVEQQRQALDAPGSKRLSRLLVTLFGVFVGIAGCAVLVNGL